MREQIDVIDQLFFVYVLKKMDIVPYYTKTGMFTFQIPTDIVPQCSPTRH